jgi:hypothetical protein
MVQFTDPATSPSGLSIVENFSILNVTMNATGIYYGSGIGSGYASSRGTPVVRPLSILGEAPPELNSLFEASVERMTDRFPPFSNSAPFRLSRALPNSPLLTPSYLLTVASRSLGDSIDFNR